MKIELEPIAYIKSEFEGFDRKITRDSLSEIVLTDDFSEDALYGIEQFSHLEIIWYFHLAFKPVKELVFPRGNSDLPQMGIFAVRGPHRPNHIATTIVRLIKKDKKTLTVYGLDAVDGTPVLDIKPVPIMFLPGEIVQQPDWVMKH
ncbi:MAG TPA: tRNA (N6-threonylcarbamoyladenosine(37)-N6)-methyltransferase TrmO [Saprospiraceae bacterium]|nr:tRNA (N6-threonylcarbamoyladenosine(37)-N6)-methyltransferase TrmO [Saprospiraceae bacterium]HHH52042.1 tRNA (N6-threonylcarbamoyladenosine(37)-N6)-methyltransferase TrmO [Bacteroidota bacterium]